MCGPEIRESESYGDIASEGL